MHQEIRDLLGVYALDALESEERERVATHLESCQECRREAEEHRERAGWLGSARQPVPTTTWDSIVSGMADTAPEPEVEVLDRNRWNVFTPYLAVLALSMIVLAIVFIAEGVQQRNSSQVATATIAALAADALQNPDSTLYSLSAPEGEATALVVVLPDGTGYLARHNLPNLAGETYQLWAVGDSVVSAGVLGGSPGVVAFKLDQAARGFAISVELPGGVVVSQNEPVVSGFGA